MLAYLYKCVQFALSMHMKIQGIISAKTYKYVELTYFMHIIIQIIDFGMARDLLREDYYMSSGGMIPVKWTAPEV